MAKVTREREDLLHIGEGVYITVSTKGPWVSIREWYAPSDFPPENEVEIVRLETWSKGNLSPYARLAYYHRVGRYNHQ